MTAKHTSKNLGRASFLWIALAPFKRAFTSFSISSIVAAKLVLHTTALIIILI
jgi:hypothetical protein